MRLDWMVDETAQLARPGQGDYPESGQLHPFHHHFVAHRSHQRYVDGLRHRTHDDLLWPADSLAPMVSGDDMHHLCHGEPDDWFFMDDHRHGGSCRHRQGDGLCRRMDGGCHHQRSLLRRQAFAAVRHHGPGFQRLGHAPFHAHPIHDEDHHPHLHRDAADFPLRGSDDAHYRRGRCEDVHGGTVTHVCHLPLVAAGARWHGFDDRLSVALIGRIVPGHPGRCADGAPRPTRPTPRDCQCQWLSRFAGAL